MSRTTFTVRIDDDLIGALNNRAKAEGQSRNYVINRVLRTWLDAAFREEEIRAAADIAAVSGVSFEAAHKAVRAHVPVQPGADDPIGPRETLTEDVQVAGEREGPHRHRFPTERPNTRRGVAGMTYATFECDCGKTVERKVERQAR